MANRNTIKVRNRRLRRRRENSLRDFNAFMDKRRSYWVLGRYCAAEGGRNCCGCVYNMTTLEMYSLKQAIELYSDCVLLPEVSEGHVIYTFFDHETSRGRVHPGSKVAGMYALNSEWNNFNPDAHALIQSWIRGQLQAVSENAWISDAAMSYVIHHTVFYFSDNLSKNRLPMVIDGNALPSTNN